MIDENKELVLYRKHANGIGTWKIWWQADVIFYSHALAEGGAESVHQEVVVKNMSGRTMAEQTHLQMKSRVSRMLDRGYKASRDAALGGATNQMGFINPMLALPITKTTVAPFETAHMQRKFDGHRLLTTRQEGKLIPYTRKGKEVDTIDHILKIIGPRIPEGATIDGELYIHGRSLQSIASCIKRFQADTLKLKYHIYDIAEDQVFSDRLALLNEMFGSCVSATNVAELVATPAIHSMAQAYDYFRRYRDEGFEGGMLRLDLRGYEDGIRSNQLVKLKEREDADFEVLDIFPGKNGVGILTLKLNDKGDTFDTLAPGTVPMKQEALISKQNYIGKRVEVAYACLTDKGVPFHCVATRWKIEL